MTSLKEQLAERNADTLKHWLRRVDAFDKTLTNKGHFVEAVARQLTGNLAGVLARLSEPERNLLAESAHQGRFLSAREFTAKYGGKCPLPSGYYGYRDEVSLLEPFVQRERNGNGAPDQLIASLIEPLRALLPKPRAVRVKTVDPLPAAWSSEKQLARGDRARPLCVFESERVAPAELARVLRLIQSGKVKVTDANRRPTDATTRLVRETLLVPDFELEIPADKPGCGWKRGECQQAGAVRAHAWPVLVQQCGWAKSRAGVLNLTAAGKEILGQFTPESYRAGVDRYLDNDDFDELHRVNHIRGQTGKRKRYISDPGFRKGSIVEALEPFPVGQWLAFEEARRVIDAWEVPWDVVEAPQALLYFGQIEYGAIYDNAGINSQFLRAFWLESLATLGILDVAYVYPHGIWPELGDRWGVDSLDFCGRYDGLLYVRVNPLGAYALALADRYELLSEERSALFRVLPNHELVLTERTLNPADRAMLELFAKPTGDMVWALDAELILAHTERGGKFSELRDYLEGNAAAGLPENVRVFLAGLEAKSGACRGCRDAVLIEWADEALAQLIATSAGTNKLCFHAGGNRVVVPSQNFTAFSRAIKKLGYVVPPRK
jgi:hypothetical protein